jgi:methylenetetrahydrofolate reductase (NADPH)
MTDAFTQARQAWPNGLLVAVAYPHGAKHTLDNVGDRQLTPLETGRVLRARDDDGALMVCSDTEYANSIQVLQDQENAGADFALTEPFYDVGTFLRFVHATRRAGLQINIIPTLRVISTASEFYRSAEDKCIRVPPGVEATVARLSRGAMSDDASKLSEYGSALAITAAKALLLRGVQHIHFEAGVPEQASGVVERLGLAKGSSPTAQEPPSESSG